MTKSVTVRQAKYFMDRIKRNELPYLKLSEHEIFDKVLDAIEENGLYEKVGQQIENEAKRIIEEIKPKAAEVVEEINALSEKINKAKTVKTKEKLKDEMQKLWEKYDSIYKGAQEELEKIKSRIIIEDNRGVKIMDINDKDYETINNIINWNIDETPRESIADKYEASVYEPKN